MKYKILIILAKIWIVFALVIIFLGYFQAFSDGGWAEVLQKIKEQDIKKLIGIIITLSPGLVLLWWAKNISDRKDR